MRASKEGQRVPTVPLAEMKGGIVRDLSSDEIFGDRRVILFALPGAFTPTCSTAHVPGYVALVNELKAAGIDDVVCLSVNDPFVMQAWQESEKAQGIHFVADPFAEFTTAMGMAVDHRLDDPFEVSDAETMLRYLRPERQTLGPVLVLARHGCPSCDRAKQMLKERDIPFDSVYLGEELTMRGIKAASGASTVPQVFIAGKLVGGSDQLAQFLQNR